jgi:hypothetical protein
MRTIPVLLTIVLLSPGTASLTAQDAKPKTPKKGDVLMIKGCLRGSAVEGAQTMTEDAEGEPRTEDQIPALTYRLQGKKELLRELKDKHDHMVVQVKGILRSELSGTGLGKDVGRTRITIGIDPRSGRSPHGTDQAVPVLEATSFEGSTVSCGR